MKRRSRPRHKQKNEPQAYCGLLSCASCGMQITGEYRVKTQLNSTQHFYTYYHCTKKSKTQKCPEPCIRQESLDAQISSLLEKVSLSSQDTEKVFAALDSEQDKAKEDAQAEVNILKEQLSQVGEKLKKLLDIYLDDALSTENVDLRF